MASVQVLLFLFFGVVLASYEVNYAHIRGRNLSYAYTPKNRADATTVTNLQTFDGALGGVVAPPIVMSTVQGRPFSVDGSTFPDFQTAASRTCDDQFTGCSDVRST